MNCSSQALSEVFLTGGLSIFLYPAGKQSRDTAMSATMAIKLIERNAHVCFKLISGIQSFIPISDNPDPIRVVLEISGKDLAVSFVDYLHRSNPFAFAVR
jgi:hypothetical protein